MRRSLHVLAALATAAAAGCGDSADPLAPAAAPRPALAVSTAPAGPGLAVVFLPPLEPARRAPFTGAFDGTRAPVVEICRWSGTACSGAPVARFTRTEGTGGALLTVDAAQQLYRVDWKAEGLVAGARYRIRVLLGGAELGFAEAQVPGGGTSMGVIVDAGLVPLGDNRTLPVRFRIETSTSYLPGEPTAPAAGAITSLPLVPRAADYSAGHPKLGAALVSHDVVAVLLAPGTTVAQANALVGEIGATLAGAVPGSSNGVGGILMLRTPTASHAEMEALLAQLRADARVRVAVQDVLLSPDAQPAPVSGVTDVEWTWEPFPSGGNWGLEQTRVPQLWNWNAAIAKAGTGGIVTGVIDDGFAVGHPDLWWHGNSTPADMPATERGHGTHVAGIIGATFDNGVGIDGVNPFAHLVARASSRVGTGTTVIERKRSALQHVLGELEQLVTQRPDVRVVNISWGYNFGKAGVSHADPAVQFMAVEQGKLFVALLESLRDAGHALPVIVVSAGNDSHFELGVQDARYNSPMAAAALALGAAPVIVVGGAEMVGPADFAVRRMPMSNVGPHLYAPGRDVVSTWPVGEMYYKTGGTSQAAPLVAGLVGYLYALAPTLPAPTMTSNPVRLLLASTGRAVAGQPEKIVDAYAAAMALDGYVGTGERVVRMLVDVDDGTADGNTRTNPDGTDHTADARGDGRVDMRDFRRWRDWAIAALPMDGAQLDGSPRHPKKDVNGNRRWAADGDAETLYARGDFNGDGAIALHDSVAVGGIFGGARVTDLQVLERLFEDEPDGYYTKADLRTLVRSGDLAVDASACLSAPNVTQVRVRVYPADEPTPLTGARTHDAQHPARVYTKAVRAGGYTAQAEALDGTGRVIARAERDFPIALGGDARWAPTCLVVSPATATVAAGSTQQFAATAAGQGAHAVTWRAARGAITATGLYSPPPGSEASVDTVTARSVAEPGSEASVVVTVTPGQGGVVMPIAHGIELNTDVYFFPMWDGAPAPATTRRFESTVGQPVKVRDLAWTDQSTLGGGFGADAGWEPWSANGTGKGTLKMDYTLTAAGAITTIAGEANVRGDATDSGPIETGFSTVLNAATNAMQGVNFRVVGAPVRFTATYSCTSEMFNGHSPSIGSSFVLRSAAGGGDHIAFDYCNAWGRGAVTRTFTGTLAPGEYWLELRGKAGAAAASGGYDLQTAISAWQFSVKFSQ